MTNITILSYQILLYYNLPVKLFAFIHCFYKIHPAFSIGHVHSYFRSGCQLIVHQLPNGVKQHHAYFILKIPKFHSKLPTVGVGINHHFAISNFSYFRIYNYSFFFGCGFFGNNSKGCFISIQIIRSNICLYLIAILRMKPRQKQDRLPGNEIG